MNQTIQELKDYIDEIHLRIDYVDYLNLINLVDEIDKKPYCKEDFRDWLVDNWEEVEEDIHKSINTILCSKQGEFNINDEVDRDLLGDYVSDNLKTGLFNVIDTYEE